jgi:hypothetical protein
MPRDNDKPFPCKDCRFEIGGVCFRNPPSAVWIGGLRNTFYPSIHNVASGCFAGEPRVQRSCDTCRIKNTCGIRKDLLSMDTDLIEWHCCEWEAKE